jgi:HK97 family phage prohead protease
MQFKQIALDNVSFKFEPNKPGIFSGYASTFNGVDAYGDTIVPGAYKKTIKKRARPVRMRWNHFGPIIGIWPSMEEDDKGLFVTGELTPDHSVAQNVYASMKHGAVDGLSIGYRAVKIEDHGNGTRTLKEIELIEISIVEEPADLGAKITEVKNLIEMINSIDELKEFESLLRDSAGFSKAAATALVSRIRALGDQGRAEKSGPAKLAELIQAINIKI